MIQGKNNFKLINAKNANFKSVKIVILKHKFLNEAIVLISIKIFIPFTQVKIHKDNIAVFARMI
jgi:hypothetical protein